MFHIAGGIILAFLILAAVREVAENIQDINYNRRIKALLRKQQGAQQDGGGDMSTSSWLILTFVCAALLLVMVVESTRLPGKVTAPDFSGVSDAQVMAILRQAGTQAPSAAPPAAAKEVDDWVTAPQAPHDK